MPTLYDFGIRSYQPCLGAKNGIRNTGQEPSKNI